MSTCDICGRDLFGDCECCAVLVKAPPPAWVKAWREGFAPLLSTAGLIALKEALERDDPRVLQGQTTEPAPLTIHEDWPVEGACPIGFAAWQGEHLATVRQVEERFALLCHDADRRLGEPAAVRYFFNHWDVAPREQVRRELLAELILALVERGMRMPVDGAA